MLEPANTQYLGGMVDHLESEQPTNFLAGLARRMGKPVAGENAAVTASNRTRTRLPPAVRNTQPVQPRARARAQIQSQAVPAPAGVGSRESQTRAFSPSKSPVKADTEGIHNAHISTRQVHARNPSPPLSSRRTPRAASTAAARAVTGLYHQTQLTRDGYAEPTPSKRARMTHQSESRSSRNVPKRQEIVDEDQDEDEFDLEFDDSFLREVDVVTASASATVSGPRANLQPIEVDDLSLDWGYEDDDSSFIRQIDEAEAQATQRAPVTTSRFFPVPSTSKTGCKHKNAIEAGPKRGTTSGNKRAVYVLDSDGSSGKENNEPNDHDVWYISD